MNDCSGNATASQSERVEGLFLGATRKEKIKKQCLLFSWSAAAAAAAFCICKWWKSFISNKSFAMPTRQRVGTLGRHLSIGSEKADMLKQYRIIKAVSPLGAARPIFQSTRTRTLTDACRCRCKINFSGSKLIEAQTVGLGHQTTVCCYIYVHSKKFMGFKYEMLLDR